MAQALECSECEHVQIVGLVPGGITSRGIPDPHVACEGCGRTGTITLAPGYAAEQRRRMAPILDFFKTCNSA